MDESRDQAALDRWQRREGVVYGAIPYVTLGVSYFLAATIGSPSRDAAYRMLGLTIFAALWMLWMVTFHPEWVGNRRALMALYFGVLVIVMAALVLQAPWYGLFGFTGYLHAVMTLRGNWRVAGVMATSVIIATAQDGGVPKGGAGALIGYAVIVAFNVALGGAIMWFGLITQEQNARRMRANDELAEANRALAASIEENRGLHALLLTQAREAGVLDERQRLAREIHDTLAQGLIGIITQLQAAEQARLRGGGRQVEEHPESATGGERRHLDAAAQLARESLSAARRSVQALQPEPLEAAGLPEALAEIVERWSAMNVVAAEVNTTGTARALHPEVEATLLRAAQEALANVARHARATRVGLTLSYMEDQITLDVRDDGVGFDPGALRDCGGTEGGYGLTAMRQRVDRLAGCLEIESEPGCGTAISASVPAIGAGAPR